MKEFKKPGVLIAAPSSGSGKSMVSVGLMAAFSEKMVVQPYKIGPDFIDPMYHKLACGKPSINLDPWMLTADQNREVYTRYGAECGLCITEGVMGLFDGMSTVPDTSTAGMAAALGLPIIAVIDCAKMAESAGALIHGLDSFRSKIRISGVICNRVGSLRHEKLLRQAIEPLSIPIFGFIPRKNELKVPERYLGLYTAQERMTETIAFIEAAKGAVKENLNLDQVFHAAEGALPLQTREKTADIDPNLNKLRIAVAKDEAFCFCYEDNRNCFRNAGIETVPFSPLHDAVLPENIQGIYIPGGYPELLAEGLSKNDSMRKEILDFSKQSGPVYAECGGLIYLTEAVVGKDGNSFPMCGILPGCSRMTDHLTLGYRKIQAISENWLLPAGVSFRGHEFHYSVWEGGGKAAFVSMQNADGAVLPSDGMVCGNVLASYIHLMFRQNPAIMENFKNAMLKGK